jgi:hypothetical protein
MDVGAYNRTVYATFNVNNNRYRWWVDKGGQLLWW